jgi:hypothetical protein
MPDTKDWSWVVRHPCPECGLDATAFTVETFGRHLVHEAVHHLYDVTGVQHSHR